MVNLTFRQLEAVREVARNGTVAKAAEVLHVTPAALTSRTHPDDRTEALRLLALVLRAGFGHDRLASEPDLAPLRQDPRYRTLIEAVQAFKAWDPPAGDKVTR